MCLNFLFLFKLSEKLEIMFLPVFSPGHVLFCQSCFPQLWHTLHLWVTVVWRFLPHAAIGHHIKTDLCEYILIWMWHGYILSTFPVKVVGFSCRCTDASHRFGRPFNNELKHTGHKNYNNPRDALGDWKFSHHTENITFKLFLQHMKTSLCIVMCSYRDGFVCVCVCSIYMFYFYFSLINLYILFNFSSTSCL